MRILYSPLTRGAGQAKGNTTGSGLVDIPSLHAAPGAEGGVFLHRLRLQFARDYCRSFRNGPGTR